MSSDHSLEQAQDEIVRLIRRCIGVLAPLQRETAERAHDLRVDLEYDSLRLVELSYVLEDAFVLEQISEEEAERIETAGDIEDLILSKMEERGYGFENDDPASALALMTEIESWL